VDIFIDLSHSCIVEDIMYRELCAIADEAAPEVEQELDSPMKCKRCGDLLSEYKQAVKRFTTAMRDASSLLRTAKETEDLARKCNDANDALLEHLRQHRRDLSPKTVSS
jgi:hypothetical protein